MSTEEDKALLGDADDDLLDYEDEDQLDTEVTNAVDESNKNGDVKKGSYVGIHSSSFRDFLLKPELLNAISDCGFEHPSEVQQECIPQAITGTDIICQAKSGMGKTAVFTLATLQLLEPESTGVDTLVLAHTRELAYQICREYDRFSKYMPSAKGKVAVLYGGIALQQHQQLLKENPPRVIVGTPGRTLALIKDGSLKLDSLKRFVLDECDQLLSEMDMRRDVQQIFRSSPHEKQVMMFSATLPKDTRPVCRKFTQHATEIFVDNESKLTLHGLQQYYLQLSENQKNRKLTDLLDALEFNQVVIFVNATRRAIELDQLLKECNFPSEVMHGRMKQVERIECYNRFKEYKSRILVSTDVFGRGVDFERVNIVINYDMPKEADQYLHRVGRSGRFGTKGLAVTFCSTDADTAVLNTIQSRFVVDIPALPDEIDVSSYMSA